LNVCIREKRARRGLSQDLVDLHVTRPRYRPTLAQRALSWGAWVLFAVSLYIALAINR
jgi:hypothetical protein